SFFFSVISPKPNPITFVWIFYLCSKLSMCPTPHSFVPRPSRNYLFCFITFLREPILIRDKHIVVVVQTIVNHVMFNSVQKCHVKF
ncbi:hypothetical protein VIGAN_04057600, partial [Vigna angularis var. angularis]